MADGLYIKPLGIIFGDHARQATEAGLALPLAGGPAAFGAAELIEGTPGQSKSVIARAATLKAMEEPAIAERLEVLSAPRPALAGVAMDAPRLMGIVNITPDSFSDGGDFAEPETALAQARRLAEEGADFVDIGGESTRPGSDPVSLEDERARVMPVLEGLSGLPAPISIDTRKAAMMTEAAAKGAKVINDVSGLTHDPDALSAAAQTGLPVILMHALGDPKTMQDDPRYDDVLLEVYDFLAARIDAAIAAGIPKERIAVDPGIGFGKTLQHNLTLLNGLSLFHGLGVPVLVGASRKRFIGTLNDEREPKKRVPGSIAAAITAASQGVQILRVHDVRETRQALRVWLSAAHGAPFDALNT
ncbi:dihydropteroate synthase [Dichotomicrobium thermohalophilum]|uniref:Dihydropteroate synthase n=1 Tax=Dichotomicrobium thermohalophilum TaxID=933063 RepID=A0A397Q4Q7_9HYPH|nr:dihydropteroate synthase [Dichotomicrobium thermohalophilum]RIA56028.1 dihydropteroate synthase [Dichotomicrobium thermohalophilum]